MKTMKSGWLREAVHGRHGLFKRVLGVGIGGALVAPVRVGELDEVEVAALRGGAARRGNKPAVKVTPAMPASFRKSRRSVCCM